MVELRQSASNRPGSGLSWMLKGCPSPPSTKTQSSGETRNRTEDTTIFSRVLYQLSYLALGWRS
jgi:hypothetical protein